MNFVQSVFPESCAEQVAECAQSMLFFILCSLYSLYSTVVNCITKSQFFQFLLSIAVVSLTTKDKVTGASKDTTVAILGKGHSFGVSNIFVPDECETSDRLFIEIGSKIIFPDRFLSTFDLENLATKIVNNLLRSIRLEMTLQKEACKTLMSTQVCI